MSYRLKIDPKSRKSARFISLLQKKIQEALVASGMTQQEVAEKLGVDRSVVNRRLKGRANLTARSIAEFAYAFDMDVDVNFSNKKPARQTNLTGAPDHSFRFIDQPKSTQTKTVLIAPDNILERAVS